jgi:Skp family chaperone for outer membrane proteins
MKRIWLKNTLLTALCATGLFFAAAPAHAQSTSIKIGVIDLKKVFDNFYKTAQSDSSFKKEAEDMDKELKGMFDDYRKAQEEYQKLFDSANDQAISADERAKAKQAAEDKYRDVANRKDAIDQYNRQAAARLEEEKRKKTEDLVTEIKDHLGVIAKSGAYNLVFDTSGESANRVPVALYANGLPDLTDALLKDLNLGAPASFVPPSATNSPGK